MPSEPSRADEELARQATDAGWPTTGRQVHELHQRKVLPPKTVPRRGRGITEAVYAKGALDVLIAVRRAAAEPWYGRLYRAVALAWLRGADVRSEALLDALNKYVDDLYRGMVKSASSTRRPHRGQSAMIADPRDRQAILAGVAAMLTGQPLKLPTGSNVAALLHAFADKLGQAVDRQSGSAIVPSARAQQLAQSLAMPSELCPRHETQAILRQLTATPLPGEAVADLSVVAMRTSLARLLPNQRELFDTWRDGMRLRYSDVTDELVLLGLIISSVHTFLELSAPRRRADRRATARQATRAPLSDRPAIARARPERQIDP